MSDDHKKNDEYRKSETGPSAESPSNIPRKSEGLNRRDALLSGASLLAASALAGKAITHLAQAQPKPDAAPPTVAQTEIDRTVLPIPEPTPHA